ncbi:MAG: hypothetical protein OEU46_21735 [Alphaproteobacteria bacterium]|nr:hypothetical protein [Alphaproteobacteria bacterium]
MVLRVIQQILTDESGTITFELGLIVSLSTVAAIAAMDYRSFVLEETFLKFGEHVVAVVDYLMSLA